MAPSALLIESQDFGLFPEPKVDSRDKNESLLGDPGIQGIKFPVARFSFRRESGQRAAATGIRVLADISEARRRARTMVDLARREFGWLSENRLRYAGQWVALDGDILLAVGDTAAEVYAAIVAYPGTPLVTRVEPAEQMPFGGW